MIHDDSIDPGMMRDVMHSGLARLRAALEVAEEAFGADDLELTCTALADVAVACAQIGAIVVPIYADVANLPPPRLGRVPELMAIFAGQLDRRGFPMSYPWNKPKEGFT